MKAKSKKALIQHRHNKSSSSSIHQDYKKYKRNEGFTDRKIQIKRPNYEDNDELNNTVTMKPAQTIDSKISKSDINHSFHDYQSKISKFLIFIENPGSMRVTKHITLTHESEQEPKDASKLPTPVKHNKPVMTRINPKQAQM